LSICSHVHPRAVGEGARLARLCAPALIAASMMAGLEGAAQSPAFDVASVKPSRSADGESSLVMPGGRYTATNVTVRTLLKSAYGVHDTQIAGGPSWINTERFDIEARKEGRTTASGFRDEARLMLRPLLADRFKLVLRRDRRDLPVYALVFAKSDRELGPQVRRSDVRDCSGDARMMSAPAGAPEPAIPLPCGAEVYRPGHLAARAMALSFFVLNLARWTDRVVVDRTGLDGRFDWEIQWTPDDTPPDPGARGVPSLVTALREQAGFSLAGQRAPVDVLVIERVERPDPD